MWPPKSGEAARGGGRALEVPTPIAWGSATGNGWRHRQTVDVITQEPARSVSPAGLSLVRIIARAVSFLSRISGIL
jgi:hypothetical protein